MLDSKHYFIKLQVSSLYILAYDINPKANPHGLRIKLVRGLKRGNATPLQKSLWLLPELSKDILKIIEEAKDSGNLIVLSEFKPLYPFTLSHVGIVALSPITVIVLRLLKRLKKIFADENIKVDVVFSGKGRPLGVIIDEVCRKGVNAIMLLTESKNVEKGIYYGGIAYEDSKLAKLLGIPFEELVYAKNGKKLVLVSWVKDVNSNFNRKVSEKFNNIETINGFFIPRRIWREKGLTYRRVLGVVPSEEIIVNDVGVAKAEKEEVILIGHKNHMVDVIGAKPYENFKKLRVDLEKAIIKSVS